MKLFLMVAMFVALGSPAIAQENCGIYVNMTASLDLKYGETRRGSGLSWSESAFEIWASDESPYTWTILKVYPSGWACLMASGKHWVNNPPVLPGDAAAYQRDDVPFSPT